MMGNFRSKIEKSISTIIMSSFLILMLLVAYATIVLDKNVESAFPNTVSHINLFYYIVSIIILLFLGVIYRKDINERVYYFLMILIPLAVLIMWQIPVAKWIYYFTIDGDFGSLRLAAIGFNNGESFIERPYYLESPNNANFAIILSWIYRICPHWRAIILLGACLTNASAVLIAISVKNLSESKTASVITLVIAEMLMAMTWRAFYVYTDNFGMIFVALFIWIFSIRKFNNYVKIPLMIICSVVGSFIKQTVLICLFGYVIYLFTKSLQEDKKVFITMMAYTLICSVLVLGGVKLAQTELRDYYKLDLNGQYPKGWQYMFMVGQNTEYMGVVNSDDPKIRAQLIDEAVVMAEDVDYINRKMRDIGLKRVKERGIWGNIKFYVEKINVAYNDGYFHNIQVEPPSASNYLNYNILYRLLWKEDGDLYQISAGTFQVLWDTVLLILLMGGIVFRKNDEFGLFSIIILGITCYVLLFEGRSKYLYMFLPVYIYSAGLVIAQYANIRKTNR